jgi:cysteinyl-tRNA synthetase
MHCNFLVVQADNDDDANKMSKSTGDFLRMQTVIDKGFDAIHYRFFCMAAHYRSELKFSWDNLDSARRSFETLKNSVVGFKLETAKLGKKAKAASVPNDKSQSYEKRFWDAMCDDFNVPKALGVLWEVIRDNDLHKALRLSLLLGFDEVLGLGMAEFKRPAISEDLRQLVAKREEARGAKDWAQADVLRDQLAEQGLQLMDTPEGTDWYKAID